MFCECKYGPTTAVTYHFLVFLLLSLPTATISKHLFAEVVCQLVAIRLITSQLAAVTMFIACPNFITATMLKVLAFPVIIIEEVVTYLAAATIKQVVAIVYSVVIVIILWEVLV